MEQEIRTGDKKTLVMNTALRHLYEGKWVCGRHGNEKPAIIWAVDEVTNKPGIWVVRCLGYCAMCGEDNFKRKYGEEVAIDDYMKVLAKTTFQNSLLYRE